MQESKWRGKHDELMSSVEASNKAGGHRKHGKSESSSILGDLQFLGA